MSSAPQNFENHSRLDPSFHLFLVPVFAIFWVSSIVILVRHPNLHTGWGVVFSTAVLFALFKVRLYSLKVQDRLIRLEERLRLAELLPETKRPQILALSERQLIALRFASDAELPALAERSWTENLKPAEIKKAVRNWRADNWRV